MIHSHSECERLPNTKHQPNPNQFIMTEFKMLSTRRPLLPGIVSILIVAAGLQAQLIPVPNGSFESQSGVGQPFGVNILIDSWQKPAKPAYFDAIESTFGIFWIQTAGVFVDNNPYGNRVGAQAAFLLSFPQVALFQDYNTLDWNDAAPTHDFNAVYQPGKSYKLTVGLFGKNMTEGSQLTLSLYYRDALDNMVTVASTTITYTPAGFSTTPPLNLQDYEVVVPKVRGNDAWARKHIGIKIESTFGYGDGYWDLDNVRLEANPGGGQREL